MEYRTKSKARSTEDSVGNENAAKNPKLNISIWRTQLNMKKQATQNNTAQWYWIPNGASTKTKTMGEWQPHNQTRTGEINKLLINSKRHSTKHKWNCCRTNLQIHFEICSPSSHKRISGINLAVQRSMRSEHDEAKITSKLSSSPFRALRKWEVEISATMMSEWRKELLSHFRCGQCSTCANHSMNKWTKSQAKAYTSVAKFGNFCNCFRGNYIRGLLLLLLWTGTDNKNS